MITADADRVERHREERIEIEGMVRNHLRDPRHERFDRNIVTHA